jgi:hypothetical protein
MLRAAVGCGERDVRLGRASAIDAADIPAAVGHYNHACVRCARGETEAALEALAAAVAEGFADVDTLERAPQTAADDRKDAINGDSPRRIVSIERLPTDGSSSRGVQQANPKKPARSVTFARRRVPTLRPS